MIRTSWKKYISVFLIFVMEFPSPTYASTIGNIRCFVTPDEKIMIHYQLTGKGTFTVAVQVSLDGGKTFDIKPVSLKGDVGKGVSPGESKKIEWEVFSDVKQLSGNIVFMLEATKEPGEPINKWLILAGIALTGSAIAAMGGGGGGKSTMETLPVEISYGLIQINVEFPE